MFAMPLRVRADNDGSMSTAGDQSLSVNCAGLCATSPMSSAAAFPDWTSTDTEPSV